jgi:ribosomal protein S12 methylthiotransferase RimO
MLQGRTGEAARTVALVTLGCARNDVDSEELAGRLAADGWVLVADAADAEVAVINTCGFVEAAKKDSIDTLLEAAELKTAGRTRAVVAVGCLAERYGGQLAEALPEADAVLGFDDYAEISDRLGRILAGEPQVSHTPADRRRLLPITPAQRPAAALARAVPGHGGPPAVIPDLPAGVAPASGPRTLRRRLDDHPVAPLKLASGCDRRCAFCAIPSFRGSFLSRPPADVLSEARWLAERGVREIILVSENSTSYGKDLGNLRALEALLPRLAATEGIDRVRVSYLQPAEMRPSLIEVLTGTPGVVPYFDLSFQHASAAVLRRMRRFGDTERFVELLALIRGHCPEAGARSNMIVGFPGETEADLAELERFLVAARLDAVGVFGYSDEDGTEAQTLDGKLPEEVVRARAHRLTTLAEELTAQRAAERVGQVVEVLIDAIEVDGTVLGRAAHQAPEVDGATTLRGGGSRVGAGVGARVGAIVRARVSDSVGVDLIARVEE